MQVDSRLVIALRGSSAGVRVDWLAVLRPAEESLCFGSFSLFKEDGFG